MHAFFAAIALAPAQTYLLQVTGRPGDEYRHRLVMGMNAEGAEGKLTAEMEITERLKSVDKGKLTWENTFSGLKVTATGVLAPLKEAFDPMEGLQLTRVVDRRNRVQKLAAGGVSTGTMGTSEVVFPAKPVRLGETWDAPVEANGRVLTIRYRLAAVNSARGRKVARITGSYLPGQAVEMTQPFTYDIDLATGRPLASAGSAVITQGQARIRMTFDIRRLPSAVVKSRA